MTNNRYLMKYQIAEARKLPDLKKYFGEFLCENEIAILFGSTGAGKSVLANQIGIAIARGENILDQTNENLPTITLILDYEISGKKLEKRIDNFELPDNLYRIDVKAELKGSDKINIDYNDIRKYIEETQCKVLIIDNIQAMLNEPTYDGKTIIDFRQQIDKIQSDYNLTILLIGHTPKKMEGLPIELNDLSGSSILPNFADSIFAINKPKNNENLRYLKQIKFRNSDYLGKVLDLQLDKTNFDHFNLIGYSNEIEHFRLNEKIMNEFQTIKDNLPKKELYKNKDIVGTIEKVLDVAISTANNKFKSYVNNGLIIPSGNRYKIAI